MIPFAALASILAKTGTAAATGAKAGGVLAKGASIAKKVSPFIKGLLPFLGGMGQPDQSMMGPQLLQPGSIDLSSTQQMQRPMVPPTMQRFY